MNQFSMDELREMAPAYVLGALNTDELAAFEAALQNSVELGQEVADFQTVVDRIGSEEQTAPPPALRVRFLQRIASEKPTSADSTVPLPVQKPVRPFTVSSGKAAPVGVAPRQRWWFTGALGTALAASLVFVVQRNGQISLLKDTLAKRDSALAERERRLSQRDSTLNTVLEADSSLLVVNLSSKASNGPGVQFLWNVKQGRGMLHAFRLKPAAAGRAYQLWLIKDGKPVASKVFNADADEHGLVWGIDMPSATTGVTALAVTDEPAGGSVQPTTTPFIVGALPKSSL